MKSTRPIATPHFCGVAINQADLDSLYYEIANCAFVEAHIMDTDNENARHTVADICQPGNRDRTDSVIRLAIAELCMDPALALRNPHAREYIIACVLADWLGIAKPEAAPRWQQRATTALVRSHWPTAFTRRLPPI